ncbi:MAG: ABC-2 family transporter protein [Anaerolineae bacterium]|nr:ABC-2 family transporter protein [Thermoflexales bacterium]MDW8407022.1 ABC-2 family transporter protein [Anaerolineae bacterium]
MLQIFRRLWAVNWAEQWQYRANLLMYLLFWLVSPIVYLAVWTTVARSQGNVNGLTANDFAAYYMILLVVDVLTSQITIHVLAPEIQNGTLANRLLLPAHPVLTQVLVNNIAFKALNLIALVPIWLVLYALFQPTLNLNLLHVLLAVPALVLAFGILFLLGSALTLVAFWTTRVWALWNFYSAVFMLFAGHFVPLALLPPALQTLAKILPFSYTLYFPIQLILGKLSAADVAFSFGMQVVWLGLAYLIFHVLWRAGVRQFSAVGA